MVLAGGLGHAPDRYQLIGVERQLYQVTDEGLTACGRHLQSGVLGLHDLVIFQRAGSGRDPVLDARRSCDRPEPIERRTVPERYCQ